MKSKSDKSRAVHTASAAAPGGRTLPENTAGHAAAVKLEVPLPDVHRQAGSKNKSRRRLALRLQQKDALAGTLAAALADALTEISREWGFAAAEEKET